MPNKNIQTDEQWRETVLELITNPEAAGFARDVLGFQTVNELRKLVRYFRSMRQIPEVTGLTVAGLNKAACIDWLLGTPGVEFKSHRYAPEKPLPGDQIKAAYADKPETTAVEDWDKLFQGMLR
jgi:hypothetical protein